MTYNLLNCLGRWGYRVSPGKFQFCKTKDQAIVHQSLPADVPCHLIEPVDLVLVKEWQKEPLVPQWSGPFKVLLTTHAAIKVAERKNWVHHSRVKKVTQSEEETTVSKERKDDWIVEPVEGIKYLFKRAKKDKPQAKEQTNKERPPPAPD